MAVAVSLKYAKRVINDMQLNEEQQELIKQFLIACNEYVFGEQQ